MRVFETDTKALRVLSKQLDQTGELFLSTRVEIQGDHLKGKVPVQIVYRSRFTPDEEFWEIDDKFPDEGPYSVVYPSEFLTENERADHCSTRYEVLTDNDIQY